MGGGGVLPKKNVGGEGGGQVPKREKVALGENRAKWNWQKKKSRGQKGK